MKRLKARMSRAQFPPSQIPKLGSKIPKMGTKKREPSNRAPLVSGVADALFTKVQQRVLADCLETMRVVTRLPVLTKGTL